MKFPFVFKKKKVVQKKPKKKPKKKPIVRKRVKKKEFEIKSTLYHNRQLFLFEDIETKSAMHLIREMIALDSINHEPIDLWINSPGGSCNAGLAIIDVMTKIKSPVRTIISNRACSMASVVSVMGDERLAFKDSTWMQHPMSAWNEGYLNDMRDYLKYLEKLDDIIIDLMRENTKLSKPQIEKFCHGELWLMGKELVDYGVVDKII